MKKISVFLVIMLVFTSISAFSAVKFYDGEASVTENGSSTFTIETVEVMDWDGITRVCRTLGADNNIWKATNGELYNYIEATKLIEVDYDNGIITNSSSHDVYLAVNSVNITVPANSRFVIKP